MKGQTVLITGGTGSFGSALVRRLLQTDAKAIRVFSRDEEKQRKLQVELDDPRVRFLLGDVRNRDRLALATRDVDVIVHAAAMKQIPACEADPFECALTNIMGTENVAQAAIANRVPRTLVLSTDKACHPANLYGTTKLAAERIITQANVYDSTARFSCTRWGNIIGSTGSVIPLFRKQMKTGELTITDEAMTRFWMTLDAAVDFVLASLERMQGGEVFVPRMPSMKITDLAKAVAPGIPHKIIGTRKGEKIHETLITPEEGPHTVAFPDYFAILPSFPYWGPKYEQGEELPPGFTYSSDHNDYWLEIKDLAEGTPPSSLTPNTS